MPFTAALLTVLIMALICQYLTGIFKTWIPLKEVWKVPVPPLLAGVIGITLAVLFEVDLFAALGFKTHYALAAWVLTGVAISAGSGPLHELFAKLQESRLPIVEIPFGDGEEDELDA